MSVVLWSFTAANTIAESPERPTSAKQASAALLSVPLSFESNEGQTDGRVKFLSRGDGYSLFLTSKEAVFTLRTPAGVKALPSVFRMELRGANRGAQVTGADKLAGVANYYVGSDPKKWRSGITTFGKVKYQGIYQGVDAVFYGNQRQLEYDFVVAPGADPQQISLGLTGAKPSLDADGNIVLKLADGDLALKKPVVYQNVAGEKRIVEAGYTIAGNQARFHLGKYDHNQTLVIDPVLSYLTYFGGSNFDSIGFESYYGGSNATNPTQGIAVDSSGNVFVTGYTQSADFPVQNAIQAVNTTQAPTGFVAKLNPAGSQLIYSTYIGGGVLHDNTTTRPYAIAVDGSGSAYVTGYTTAPQFPVTGGAYQMRCGYVNAFGDSCPNTQSAFLTKLSPSGNLVYSTFLGYLNETGVAVAVDSQGRAYVAGNSVANCTTLVPTCFPTTPNAVLQGTVFNNSVNPLNQQVGSAFISVFDAAGANLLYSSLYGYSDITTTNHGATYGVGVAVDASGNFYLAGDTQNNGLPVTAGAFQHYIGNMNPALSSNSRGFVAKFSPVSSGATLLYATYLGGTDPAQGALSDGIGGIAADAAGNAYVSGNASYNFPVTAGAYDATPCPSNTFCQNRAFLAKINPAGSALVWATFIGGTRPDLSAVDSISAPRLDANGNVYVSGAAGNNTEVPLVNPLQPANTFGGVLVTKFDPTGSTVLFSTVIYSTATNGGLFSSGVDVDTQGNVYVAGNANVGGLPVTVGAFQQASAGSADGFIAKINLAPSATTPTVPPNSVVNNASFVVGTNAIAPGAIVAIFGSNLNDGSQNPFSAFGANGRLLTMLGGASVTFNGFSAAMFSSFPGQLNVEVPLELAGSASAQVVVTVNGQQSAPQTVQISAASPGIFSINSQGNGQGAIQIANSTTFAAPSGSIGGAQTRPATVGVDFLTIYCTGLGSVNNPPATGAAGSGQSTVATPLVNIGGVPATVSFSGLAPGFVALYQVNVQVPAGAPTGNAITVAFSISGKQSNSVTIAVGP